MSDFASGYGKPLVNHTQTAPIIPPKTTAFNMAQGKPGVPGFFAVGDNMAKRRDLSFNFRNSSNGFSAVRWCPSWIRTDSNPAYWEPAGSDIYNVKRKGPSGVDAQTLVFTCSPNTALIPNGDSVVIWEADSDVSVIQSSNYDLSGFALPVRSKLIVTNCIPSQAYNLNGRQVVEIQMGAILPAIDFSPAFFTTNGVSKSPLQMRHWSFYKDEANGILRNPIAYYAKLTQDALSGGAYVMLGGNQWAPSNYDWSKDYFNFGASLIEELYRKECEGLADIFGNSDTNKLAVELENNVIHAWNTVNVTTGYKVLLDDVFYPIARAAWGDDRTICVKCSGGLDGMVNVFDWKPPTGSNTHLVAHGNDGNINGPNGIIDFSSIAESDWLAEEIREKIISLGFAGGGIIDLSIDDVADIFDKSERFGRVLTSMTNAQLYTFFTGVSDTFTIDGSRIEALYPEMRQFARRAGLVYS